MSTDTQEAENQLHQLRDFASKQGWIVVREYCDVASGGKSDREQFQAMLEAASRRQFENLLFWSLDRLTREGALLTIQYLNRLSDWGVYFRSHTEPYLDSCGMFRDAVIAILGCIAKQERARISERTKAGLDRPRRQGRRLGRARVAVDADRIRVLRGQGLSWEALAEQTGIKRATCQRAVNATARNIEQD